MGQNQPFPGICGLGALSLQKTRCDRRGAAWVRPAAVDLTAAHAVASLIRRGERIIAIRRRRGVTGNGLMHDLWRHSLRTLLTGFLACTLYVLSPALAFGQPQVPPRPEGERDQLLAANELARLLQRHVPPSQEVDTKIAGLPASSHPELLTWERVYALALVRAVEVPGRAPRRSTRRPSQNRPREMGSPTSRQGADPRRCRRRCRAGYPVPDPSALRFASRL